LRDLVLNPIRGLTDPQDPVPLDPDGMVTIGRAGTLKVHDELVSIHHAQVFFDLVAERYVVRDLDSSSGTMVDGECIRNDVRPIRAGTVLRFGSAAVRVERARRASRMLMWFALVFVVAVAAMLSCITGVTRYNQVSTKVLHTQTTVFGQAEGPSKKVEVPPTWLRRHGLPWNPVIIDVTNELDSNPASELWITVGEKLAIVTFAEDGSWVDLGMIPLPFRRAELAAGRFPVLEAAGETWEMDPDEGVYQPVKQDGVVVWYREEKRRAAPAPAEKAKADDHAEPAATPGPFGLLGGPKPMKVARVPVKDTERLGQFFVERSVYGKVHYVICEGAFEGIRSQVVTSSGHIELPSPGCIEGLRLDANPESKIYGKPFAVALTPAGRRALVDDVLTFYAGEASALFLSAEDEEKIEGLRSDPGTLSAATRLLAGDARVVVSDPFPPGDARLPDVPRALEPAGRPHKPSPPAKSIVVEGPGTYEFELGDERPERFRVSVDDQLDVVVEEVSTGKPLPVLSVDASTSGGSKVLDPLGLEVRVRILHYNPIGEDRVQEIRVGVRAVR
jgi:hypothetical protein